MINCQKIAHFITITEETLAEDLTRLFRDNIQKLHRLSETVISNRGLQFVAELIKELNKILGIEMRLSTVFHPQMDRQMKYVTNFIQLVSLQPVDQFSQTKLHYKAPNEGYLHICEIYKSNNKQLRYQAISNCKSFIC